MGGYKREAKQLKDIISFAMNPVQNKVSLTMDAIYDDDYRIELFKSTYRSYSDLWPTKMR